MSARLVRWMFENMILNGSHASERFKSAYMPVTYAIFRQSADALLLAVVAIGPGTQHYDVVAADLETLEFAV